MDALLPCWPSSPRELFQLQTVQSFPVILGCSSCCFPSTARNRRLLSVSAPWAAQLWSSLGAANTSELRVRWQPGPSTLPVVTHPPVVPHMPTAASYLPHVRDKSASPSPLRSLTCLASSLENTGTKHCIRKLALHPLKQGAKPPQRASPRTPVVPCTHCEAETPSRYWQRPAWLQLINKCCSPELLGWGRAGLELYPYRQYD